MSNELYALKTKARDVRRMFDELMADQAWQGYMPGAIDAVRTAITDLYAPKPDMEITRRLLAAKTMEPEKAEPADIVRPETDIDDADSLIEDRRHACCPPIHEQRRLRSLELALEYARQAPAHNPLDSEEVVKTAARFTSFLRTGKSD